MFLRDSLRERARAVQTVSTVSMDDVGLRDVNIRSSRAVILNSLYEILFITGKITHQWRSIAADYAAALAAGANQAMGRQLYWSSLIDPRGVHVPYPGQHAFSRSMDLGALGKLTY